MPEAMKYQVPELNRALNGKYRLFGRSGAESLMRFLEIRGRKYVAEKIRNAMPEYGVSSDISSDMLNKKSEKEAFLKAVLEQSQDVYQIARLPKINGEDNKAYKQRLREYYQTKGYVADVHAMHEYKKLVSQTANELGYESNDYMLFGKPRKNQDGTKLVDMTSDKDILDNLVDYAVMYNGAGDFIPVYSYNELEVKKIDEHSDLSKQNSRRRKNILYYVLFAMAAIIGIGEGFAPAKFYLSMLMGAGLAMPIPVLAAGFAFFAAFCVNTILFRDHSFATFKDLLFKNRFFKDATGKKLGTFGVLRNFIAFSLALFSAAVIAGLSFFFSGFGALPAAFIAFMTFLGFLGVLTYAMMSVLKLETVQRLLNHIRASLWDPLVAIFKDGLSLKSLLKNSITFTVNFAALALTVVFGISVVAATGAMFFGAISGIPLVAGALGSLGVMAVVGVAEIALGTFFIINISAFVGFVRNTLFSIPSTIAGFFKNLFFAQKPESDGVYKDHSRRSTLATVGKVTGLTLVAFAVVNAGGFAVGYLTTAATHAAVVSALGFGLFSPPLLLLLAPVIATIVYFMSSVGGNAKAAVAATSVDANMHIYDEKFRNEFDETIVAAKESFNTVQRPVTLVRNAQMDDAHDNSSVATQLDDTDVRASAISGFRG